MLLSRERGSVLGEGWARDGEAGMEEPTTDKAGIKGSEEEAAPASKDDNDLFKTGDVEGNGVKVGAGAGVDAVDELSVISGSAHDATISSCVVPSKGRDNIAAEGTSCSAEATTPGGDASVERGLA